MVFLLVGNHDQESQVVLFTVPPVSDFMPDLCLLEIKDTSFIKKQRAVSRMPCTWWQSTSKAVEIYGAQWRWWWHETTCTNHVNPNLTHRWPWVFWQGVICVFLRSSVLQSLLSPSCKSGLTQVCEWTATTPLAPCGKFWVFSSNFVPERWERLKCE